MPLSATASDAKVRLTHRSERLKQGVGMRSFYDLQLLADYRIEQRRAEADRQRMVSEARCSNTVTPRVASEPLVGRFLRLRTQLLHGHTLSFDKAAPRTT